MTLMSGIALTQALEKAYELWNEWGPAIEIAIELTKRLNKREHKGKETMTSLEHAFRECRDKAGADFWDCIVEKIGG